MSGRGIWRGAAIVVAAASFAACGAEGGRTEYANEGDSGAAAPATKIDMSATRDSGATTDSLSQRTGQRGVAGDTAGSKAGVAPPTRKP